MLQYWYSIFLVCSRTLIPVLHGLFIRSLTESQIFTQRKTNFKSKKHTILTMIIFYPSHVFISHFVGQCKSFMEPKLGYTTYCTQSLQCDGFFSGKNERNISKFYIILMLYASTFRFCCPRAQNLYSIPSIGAQS